ncbi:unnamed protein product [Auanema sp. JU1783]|nr:unnamed protein product [Auanema sp. JU1783]
MMSLGPIRTADEFIPAFESILESIIERKESHDNITLSEDGLNTVQNLFDVVSSGDLRPEPSAADTLAWCDGFIADWESSGGKSAAVQQLITLLRRPHVRGVLMATEDISSCRYLPQLPSVPFEVDEDEGIAVKIVRISRKDEPLGATIRCENGKVIIARIIAGGVADRSACIQEGDRVLEVNGYPVSPEMSADDIVRLLNKSENGSVTFKLIPPEIPSTDPDHTQLFIRAQFDYNGSNDSRQPCPETSLSFKKGDILELLVCTDTHWWQARCIGNSSLAGNEGVKSNCHRVGLIPSEFLQHRLKMLERDRDSKGPKTNERSRTTAPEEELVYESVCRFRARPGIIRPIILIGPPGVGRNELKRRLLMLFPERFSTTIPHTSRSPRPGEKQGVDYYYVPREQMESMISRGDMLEFGEYRGNLYGTALSSVELARDKGTPLLTPHPLALRQLRTPEFRPIIIFVQPPDLATFKETRSAFRARTSRAGSMASAGTSTIGRGFSDSEIEQIVESGRQLEEQYGHLFDARLINCNLEESLSRLITLIQAFETRPSWVPLSWATRE